MDTNSFEELRKAVYEIRDAILGTLDGNMPGMRNTIQDHENRLCKLEKESDARNAWMKGVFLKVFTLATLGGLAALVVIGYLFNTIPVFKMIAG